MQNTTPVRSGASDGCLGKALLVGLFWIALIVIGYFLFHWLRSLGG
jgi:hypothetical protein